MKKLQSRLESALRFLDRLWRPLDVIFGRGMFERAAQTAFYLLLGFFPLGLFAISVLSRFEPENFVPPDTMIGGLMPEELIELLTNAPAARASSGWLLLGSAWAASAGVWALMKAVHRAHTGKGLPPFPARFAAIGFTLGFIVVLALSFGLMVFGRWFGITASWLAVYTLLFALYNFNFLPKDQKPKPRRNALAASISATLWMVATYGFEVYMTYFSRYTELYGGIGVFLGLALWLYIVSLVVILGAQTGHLTRESFVAPPTQY